MRLPNILTRASVWNQLLLTISGIILTVWLVLAVSILFFLKAQRDYAAIASEQIPALAAMSALAEYSAQLSTVATQIVGQSGTPDTAAQLELGEIVSGLTASLAPISQTEGTGEAPEIVVRVSEGLAQIQRLQGAIGQAERDMGTQLNALRWLNADVQDEVDPLLSDFAFNISIAMSSLVTSADPDFRARQARLIEDEGQQRDTVRRLGDSTANTVTLIFQAAVAENRERLAQLQGLTDDALVRIARLRTQLQDEPELTTLRQSVEALVPVATSETGIFRLRLAWLDAQADMLASLAALQTDLGNLQLLLSRAGQEQRARILAQTERSRRDTTLAIR